MKKTHSFHSFQSECFITTEGKPGQYKTVLLFFFYCMSFYQIFNCNINIFRPVLQSDLFARFRFKVSLYYPGWPASLVAESMDTIPMCLFSQVHFPCKLWDWSLHCVVSSLCVLHSMAIFRTLYYMTGELHCMLFQSGDMGSLSRRVQTHKRPKSQSSSTPTLVDRGQEEAQAK